MDAKLNFAAPHQTQTVAVAAIATVIALGILTTVGTLFQSRGAPLAQLAAAERACMNKAYHSERQACMQEWVEQAQAVKVAGR